MEKLENRNFSYDRFALWKRGSPLQNLIKNNHESTILSATKCGDELDAGDIYLKPLSLYGSAGKFLLEQII